MSAPLAAHAPLAPSSAARRVQCPGSRVMCELFPDVESEASREGDLAHAVAAAMLQGKPTPVGATDEMLDGAELWMETIGMHAAPHIEEWLEMPNIHPDCWGTPDFWAVEDYTITLADYKFGHRYVDIFQNWQLLEYLAGIVHKLRIPPTDWHKFNVHMVIVQPRSFHRDGPVRSWHLTLQEAGPHFAGLAAIEKKAMDPNAVTIVGAECRDCPARHACQSAQAAAYATVELAYKAVPFDLPNEIIGLELSMMKKAADILNARIGGLENEVLGRIKLGNPIQGWMLEQGNGREKWNQPIEQVLMLGEMMGVNISKPGAVTPKQAIKAGIPADVVRQYSETPVGEVKLVADDGRKAKKAFAA